MLRNISVSGALLTTDAPLQLSGHLEVLMFAKSTVLHPINAAHAHVVRVCADGFGIEWSELSPPAVQLLTRMLSEPAPEAEAEQKAATPPRTSSRRRQNARRR